MRILEGIRVLDFTQYLSGPTVTRLMAEMGAEIIKIESARLSAQPDLPDLSAPLLGQHNAEVLGALLGYSDSRIRQLAQGGILVRGDR